MGLCYGDDMHICFDCLQLQSHNQGAHPFDIQIMHSAQARTQSAEQTLIPSASHLPMILWGSALFHSTPQKLLQCRNSTEVEGHAWHGWEGL